MITLSFISAEEALRFLMELQESQAEPKTYYLIELFNDNGSPIGWEFNLH